MVTITTVVAPRILAQQIGGEENPGAPKAIPQLELIPARLITPFAFSGEGLPPKEEDPQELNEGTPVLVKSEVASHVPEPEADVFTHETGFPVALVKLAITAPTGHVPVTGAMLVGLTGPPHPLIKISGASCI